MTTRVDFGFQHWGLSGVWPSDGAISLAPIPLILEDPITTAEPAWIELDSSGRATYDLQPTGVGQGVSITVYNVPNFPGHTWVVAIPDVPTITFADLIKHHLLDPATLTPSMDGQAAWDAAIAQVQALVASVPTTNDAVMAQVAADKTSAFAGQLSATYAAHAGWDGILTPWLRTLSARPSTAVIATVGDSTRDIAAPGMYWHQAIKSLMTPGEPLEGMAPSNLVNFGYNGQATADITSTEHMTALTAARPDLVEVSMGINDIRAHDYTVGALAAILATGIDAIRAAVPGTPVVVSIPNPFLTADVGSNGYVVPNADAQTKSATLRTAWLSLAARWPNVYVRDTAAVFGTVSLASSPLMGDQIHPSAEGAAASARGLGALIGRNIPASWSQVAAARLAAPYTPWVVYGREVEDTDRYVLVASGTFLQAIRGSDILDFAYPGGRRNNILKFDIVELPDGTSFQIPSNGDTNLYANGPNTRLTVTAGTIPEYSAAVTGSAGTVRVWRQTTAIDAAVDDVFRDTSYRYRKVGRLDGPTGAGAATYVDIASASVTDAVQTEPGSAWTLQDGDAVYIDGDTTNPLIVGTNATAGTTGNNARLYGIPSGDRSALVGRLVIAVGNHG